MGDSQATTMSWGCFILQCRANRYFVNAGHNGDGRLWSSPEEMLQEEDKAIAFKWNISFCWDDPPFVKMNNCMHTDQWLHCGHDGNGEMYVEPDDGNDVYKWELNNVSKKFFFVRNKAYPDQYLRLENPDGQGNCCTTDDPCGDRTLQWKFFPAEGGRAFKGPKDDRWYSMTNVATGMDMYTGHDGNKVFYCNCEYGTGGDGPYHWYFDRDGGGLATFKTYWTADGVNTDCPLHLHVGHDGNGQLYIEEGPDDSGAYYFYIIPAGDGSFMFRNVMHPDQYITSDGDGPQANASARPNWDTPEYSMWYITRRDVDEDDSSDWD